MYTNVHTSFNFYYMPFLFCCKHVFPVDSPCSTWRLFVEDFMIRDVKYVPFTARYIDIQNLLLNTYHRAYPLVDSPGSNMLNILC